jgi:hypothetical protein
MRTEYHSIQAELEKINWPINPHVIPSYTGINSYPANGMSWTQKNNGDFISLSIYFDNEWVDKIVDKPTNPDEITMKTEYHPMQGNLDKIDWPFVPEAISDEMNLDLNDIEGMSWTRQSDGELVSLTIYFQPVLMRTPE